MLQTLNVTYSEFFNWFDKDTHTHTQQQQQQQQQQQHWFKHHLLHQQFGNFNSKEQTLAFHL
jgi:hypothetical protein